MRALTPDGEGWGECVAMDAPLYSYEYVEAAQDVVRRFLLPRLFAAGDVTAGQVAHLLEPVKGHPMAKAAVEMALLDAELRAAGQPLRDLLRRDARPGAVRGVGRHHGLGRRSCSTSVGGYLDEGYVRIKLKIEPGWDVEPVRAVRERFGDDLLLQVDANTAYTLGDARQLARARPVRPAAHRAAAARGRRARARRAGQADRDAGLPGRVGDLGALGRGRDRARRLPDHQHQARPGRRLPRGAEDRSRRRRQRHPGLVRRDARDRHRPRRQRRARRAARSSRCRATCRRPSRFYARDITEPFVLDDGHIRVPTGPGIGVDVLPDVLDECTTAVETVRP